MTSSGGPELRLDPSLPPAVDFVLRLDEPVAAGSRRIVTEQLAQAVHLLRFEPDLDRTVHEMRKSFKRCRAVLRLVRGGLGRFRYRQENVVLRDLGRAWAPARDGVVVAGVAEDLIAAAGLADSLPARRLVAELSRRAAATTEGFGQDRPLWLDTVTTLLSLTSRVRRFDGAELGDTFDAVRPGLARVAGRARREMRIAQREPSVENLHRWRKRVKYLGYQIALLEPISPDALSGIGERLSTIGSALGDDHDLAVLDEVIAGHPVGDEAWRRDLRTVVAREREEQQARALALAGSVVHEPDEIIDLIGDAWRTARR